MSSEIFKPASKTIRKLLSDSDSFYEIPDYQRPYQWEPEQVDQLWDDLFATFESSKKSGNQTEDYFLGSIILIRSGDHFDVVDGQQRLTTLTILMSVVRDLYPSLDSRTRKIIENSLADSVEGKSRLRFRTSTDNQNEFEQTILNGVKFPEVNKSRKVSRYLTTAVAFREHLHTLDQTVVAEFLNFILEHVQMISITCEDQSVAIKLFQVLNARGVDLNPSDLIKSFLLNKLPDRERAQFMATWRSIDVTAKDMDETLDSLFNYYVHFLKASNPENGIYEELTKLLKGRDANEIIHEFSGFVTAIKEVTIASNKYIFTLRYLRHQLYWKTILAAATFHARPDVVELAKSLRDFYYGHWIAGYTSYKIKQISYRIIQLVNGHASLDKIQQELTAHSDKNRISQRLKTAVTSDAYNERWLKPLLLAIEYAQIDSVQGHIDIDRQLHVEHVLPVAFSKNADWSLLFSKELGRAHVNTISNLTLISGKKNIAASNSAFAEKIIKYEGKGDDGLTSFRITQRIRDRYQSGHKVWDLSQLEERFSWLTDELRREFGFEIAKSSFASIDEDASEHPLELIESSVRDEPSSFNEACMSIANSAFKREFKRNSKAVYSDPAGKIAVCKVSKMYDKDSYWFGISRDKRRLLDQDLESNLCIFGCGDAASIVAFKAKDLAALWDKMVVTNNPEQFHWHIYLERSGGKWDLKLKGGERVDVSRHALVLQEQKSAS